MNNNNPPQIPESIRKRIEERDQRRKSNWSRSNKKKRSTSDQQLKKKSKLELFKLRMNYRVRKTENSPKKEESAEKFERFSKKYFKKREEEENVDYNSKGYKMMLFKKRMTYRTKNPITEPFALHKVEKSLLRKSRRKINLMFKWTWKHQILTPLSKPLSLTMKVSTEFWKIQVI